MYIVYIINETNVTMEMWKVIPGYEGHYEASSDGRIRSVDRVVIKKDRHTGTKMKQFYKGRLLRPSKSNKRGSLSVHVSVNNKKSVLAVHRAVLLAFVGSPKDGYESCHNNGIASDNRLKNLRWDTHLNNNRDRKLHGTYPKGLDHPMVKFTPSIVEKIRNGELGQKESGVSVTHYYRIKRGDSWKHIPAHSTN